jgi:hypothetical protein
VFSRAVVRIRIYVASALAQASVARYAELEEALAQAEQSMDHIIDDDTVRGSGCHAYVADFEQ